MKLYTVEIVAYPTAALDALSDDCSADPEWRPSGWLSDPEAREAWIATYGNDRFFWPKTGVVYKSRSAAQARAELIKSYGAVAVVLVAEPEWRSLNDAKAEREARRRDERIAALREQIAALESAA